MVDKEKAGEAIRSFLEALGLDLTELDMEKTPQRVADMYAYLFNGLGKDTKHIWGELFQAENDSIVAVKNIPFYSMCEHHLVPFFGRVSLAYKPGNGLVAGFSKFTKLVELLSHRPQLQAQQLCMTMRGDMANGTTTLTSASRGCFAENSELYHQAWMLLGQDN